MKTSPAAILSVASLATISVPTYIHKPGCGCNVGSADYALRLIRARLDAFPLRDEPYGYYAHARHDQEGARGDWSAAERYPVGCCLAWQEGEGWPGDYRDHHLLALHAAALAASPVSRGAIGGPMAEWAEGPEAHDAAQAALDALAVALGSAPWGAQPDGSFVTLHATQVGRSPTVATLHAPGRGGPLAVAEHYRSDWGTREWRVGLTALRTVEEARTIREEERRVNMERAAQYEAVRREAGSRIAAGEGLEFCFGQEGGTVSLGEGRPVVSAPGALTAAGFSRSSASEIIDRAWEEHGHLRDKWVFGPAPGQYRSVLVLGMDGVGLRETSPRPEHRRSLRALPARVRRLPAAQRAQAGGAW